MNPEEITISEKILEDTKKVKINKKEVKFHIVNNSIIFDEPIFIQSGETIEIETILNEDGTQVVKGVLFCSSFSFERGV